MSRNGVCVPTKHEDTLKQIKASPVWDSRGPLAQYLVDTPDHLKHHGALSSPCRCRTHRGRGSHPWVCGWLENEGNTAHLVAFWVGYDMAVGSCVRRSQAVQVALSLHPLAVLESKVASVDHIDCASRPQSMVEVHDPSQNRSVAPANRASVHQKPKIT